MEKKVFTIRESRLICGLLVIVDIILGGLRDILSVCICSHRASPMEF
ncbi:MAG: hypothetical protein R6U96_05670 [Promethearchaeia archaeon]